jgi:NAD(P)H-hydrate epimerase
LLEFKEVHVLDKNAEALGVPTLDLMENAGAGIADFIVERFVGKPDFSEKKPKVLFFCGVGNNGGDGFVAARHLKDKVDAKIILTAGVESLRTELAKTNFDKISLKMKVIPKPKQQKVNELLMDSDIIVDAMLGVGLTGELRKPYDTYVKLINGSEKVIISVDAPTGLGTQSVIKPAHTITFHDSKIGMNEKNSGEIIVTPIGIPEDAVRNIGPGELIVYYPHPVKGSHKGQNGRLLIVGGGPYTGAPSLAALAALRTGVDLVHIATPARSSDVIAGYSPNFIVHGLEGAGGYYLSPDDIEKVVELAGLCDACVIGPGIGREHATMEFVRGVLGRLKIPVVLDADGLSAISDLAASVENRPEKGWVVTPHYNEFLNLSKAVLKEDIKGKLDGKELEDHLRVLSAKLGVVIVLKGAEDIVCAGNLLKFNKTGNPGMTVGGTGDVLAGIIGAMASKNINPYNAGRIGVFISGSAGDIVWKEKGPGITATDIIDAIPKVITSHIKF